MSNFWRSLDFPLIDCEIEIDLSWSKKCLLSEVSITPGIGGNPRANPPLPAVVAIQTTGATFQINYAKLYAPDVTLSINDDIKFWENIKQRPKRTISWNKYRSEITQPKTII